MDSRSCASCSLKIMPNSPSGSPNPCAKSGYAVDVIERGDHAAAALLTQTYDLAILDLSLPGMDGLALLQRIRHQEKTARLPVLP